MDRICTFNRADFEGFPDLEIVTPKCGGLDGRQRREEQPLPLRALFPANGASQASEGEARASRYSLAFFDLIHRTQRCIEAGMSASVEVVRPVFPQGFGWTQVSR